MNDQRTLAEVFLELHEGIEQPIPEDDAPDLDGQIYEGTVVTFSGANSRNGEMIVVIGGPGTGKCIRFDTPVFNSNNGNYYPIKQIVHNWYDVLSKDSQGTIFQATPNAFLNMGRKECLRIKTIDGRELSGTPETMLMTVDGWKRIDELSVGEHIESVRQIPEPMFPENPSNEEVVLLAALLAEGGYTSDSVSFTNQDKEMVSLVSESCKSFNAEFRKGTKKHCYMIRWNSALGKHGKALGTNPARVLLNKYGCGYNLAKEKEIPEQVFSFSNEKLALFLGVFWGCDGYFDYGRTNIAGITLASGKMIFQIQHLLLRFGILSGISYKPVKLKGKVFDSWRLSVYSTAMENFKKHINPIIKHKQNALNKIQTCTNPNIDNIPITQEIIEKIKKATELFTGKERQQKLKKMSESIGRLSPVRITHLYRRKTVSRRLLKAFIEEFKANELLPLLTNHWCEIVSIKNDDIQEVHDLTINGPDCFIANDFIVHNSFAIKRIIAAEFTIVNSDRVLEMFADVRNYKKNNIVGQFQRSKYSDPSQIDLKNPEVTRDFYNYLRKTSSNLLAKMMTAFASRKPEDLPNLLIDTTGQNIKKLVDLAKYAKDVGYRTTLVYVFADKKTAWERNIARSRSVPLDQFEKIHEVIPTIFKAAFSLYDRIWTVESENDLVWSKDKNGVVTKPNPDRVKRLK